MDAETWIPPRLSEQKFRVSSPDWRKGSDTPWMLDGFRDESGKRGRLFFPSREAAYEKRAELLTLKKREGWHGLKLSPGVRADAERAVALLAPFGKSIGDAVDFYVAKLKAERASCAVETVIAELLVRSESDGLSKRHRDALRLQLAKFSAVYGPTLIASIESKNVDDFLSGLKVSPATRNQYRRYLSILFSFAKTRGYCATNPVSSVSVRKSIPAPTRIFTPEQTTALLTHAPSEIVPALALRAFAGLRESEVQRLDWAQIKITRGFIEVTADNAKTRSRRIVPILPNLAAWLTPHTKESGPVIPSPRRFRKLLEAARTSAELDHEWTNELRHGFGSYRLAVLNDVARVASEMGNTSDMIVKHYREIVAPDDAARYWAISPPIETNVVRAKFA